MRDVLIIPGRIVEDADGPRIREPLRDVVGEVAIGAPAVDQDADSEARAPLDRSLAVVDVVPSRIDQDPDAERAEALRHAERAVAIPFDTEIEKHPDSQSPRSLAAYVRAASLRGAAR